jgi:DNA helicase II / ATP-dependent DNA helicase PcrA
MPNTFELSEEKKRLLNQDGHLLVLGGPGSGKTTIALLKAEKLIEDGLNQHQKILFLSFARATIARVEEKAKGMLNPTNKKWLEINTYHGFIWGLLRSHGYLINNNSRLKLLTPPDAAARLASFSGDQDRDEEKLRLLNEEGLLHFDLFASSCALLLSRSEKLSSIICNKYPVVILDEFQDTHQDEWNFIQELGKRSTLIALADLEQRIYGFRGADPARVGQFIDTYNPEQFDFGNENHRSSGTDITQFGNDLLTGANRNKTYNNVRCIKYRFYNPPHIPLKTEIIGCIRRLKAENTESWSLAILVPTKNLMMTISDFLSQEQTFGTRRLPPIEHDVLLEMAGPSLAAVLIARLLGKESKPRSLIENCLIDLDAHIRGRSGNTAPARAKLQLSEAIRNYIETGAITGKNRKLLVSEITRIAQEVQELEFSGVPGDDWISVRRLLQNSASPEIKQIGEDARYLRLLRKGAILNSGLSDLWRANGNYEGASSLISNALIQEHFSATKTTWKGVHIMTMHAAKGKEFDEVIIYEGPGRYRDKIMRQGANDTDIDQARLALRVAVTRAMKNTAILTPTYDACSLL